MNVFSFLSSLGNQAAKGAYTNWPEDPNYFAHQNGTPLAPGEALVNAMQGVYRPSAGRLTTEPVVVRETAQNLYIDTQNLPRPFDPLTRAVTSYRKHHGAQPLVVPRAQVTETPTSWVLPATLGGGMIEKRPDVPLGRPADMTAGEQIANLRRMFHR